MKRIPLFKTWTSRISTILFSVLALVVILSFGSCSGTTQSNDEVWPEISSQTKPWTRWWWMGNAVDKANITRQMEAFQQAGLGGVEITPIYGVKGYESQFIDYLSPQYLEMLDHTANEAKRLGLQVDMVMGTGWPYGGPQVEPEFAASKLVLQKYVLKANEKFDEPISINDRKQKDLAVLQKVVFVDEIDGSTDLTPLLDENHLMFTSKNNGVLYALFCAKTRQQVKRSAPGGAGYVLDHFSKEALDDYVLPFETLKPFEGRLRAMFNDSYEVYQADFSPNFLKEFKERRGYDLIDQLPLLESDAINEDYLRLLCDYRETLADMLLNNFAVEWHDWSNNNGFKTKYQAHGSPANLIDLYAAADIPECEVFGSPSFDIPGYRRDTSEIRKGDSNKMMFKFASSAAHLKGDELVSSETFTWLREHFKTALSQAKPVAEDLFLSGVNHIFLHGATYSPTEETWPGWKFYASVNFNPTNTIWHDAPALFSYITKCQSVLQNTSNDNEILLYWPIYDAFTQTDPKHLLTTYNIHSIDEWMLPTSFYKAATDLDSNGYFFDFISDQFVSKMQVNGTELQVNNKASYKAIVVPAMDNIPVETLQELLSLKKAGANVIFLGAPKTVPGAFKYKEREAQLKKLLDDNVGYFESREPLTDQLQNMGIAGETLSQYGLKILRKKWNGEPVYLLVNHSAKAIDEYLPFRTLAKSALLMDALTGKTGKADVRANENGTKIKIQLKPGQSLFVKTSGKEIKADQWKYISAELPAIALDSKWNVKFIQGGPELPQPLELDNLVSWTSFGPSYSNFSGTAEYSTQFSINLEESNGYLLDLGDIRESARIKVNGHDAGTLFANPFVIDITPYLLPGNNQLSVEVTNLPANRLSALERSGYEWKKFYEINMVNIHYKPFNAGVWEPTLSGLNSAVKIIPVTYE
ncbi:MAG: glycosyl hydrolase [Prolixibacteraceae bacterium]